MAAKYPGLSPYVYCTNNPIKYVDPDGRLIVVSGEDAQRTVDALSKEYSNLTITRDTTSGQLTISGIATTDAEKKLVAASGDKNITVNLTTVKRGDTVPGTNDYIFCGAYGGSTIDANGVVQTSQYVNMDHGDQVEGIGGWSAGELVTHEIIESYIGGQNSPGQPFTEQNYTQAHNAALKVGPPAERTWRGPKMWEKYNPQAVWRTVTGPNGRTNVFVK